MNDFPFHVYAVMKQPQKKEQYETEGIQSDRSR